MSHKAFIFNTLCDKPLRRVKVLPNARLVIQHLVPLGIEIQTPCRCAIECCAKLKSLGKQGFYFEWRTAFGFECNFAESVGNSDKTIFFQAGFGVECKNV